jgi:hypothetical protein
MGPVPQSSTPPPSPDVMSQQVPPMGQFGAAGGQMLSGAAPQPDPKEFAMSELNEIKGRLMNVAKVLSQTNPELMPIVGKMAEAGSALENGLTVQPSPGGQPDTPPQSQSPQDLPLGQ